MSKHNYSQYSNKKNNNKVDTAPEAAVELQNGEVTEVEIPVVETVETESVTAAPEKEVVIEAPEVTEQPKVNSGAITKGVVTNCAKLNVRVKPSVKANVVCVLDAKAEVTIDVDKSNDEWLKVRTVAGDNGYCMRKFVDANL